MVSRLGWDDLPCVECFAAYAGATANVRPTAVETRSAVLLIRNSPFRKVVSARPPQRSVLCYWMSPNAPVGRPEGKAECHTRGEPIRLFMADQSPAPPFCHRADEFFLKKENRSEEHTS